MGETYDSTVYMHKYYNFLLHKKKKYEKYELRT